MNRIQLLFILCGLINLLSCDKSNEVKNIDCSILTEALLNIDDEKFKSEINKLMIDLKPIAQENDIMGHKENFKKLITRLNSQCGNIEINLICYSCIKTEPPQSEIDITIDSSGVEVSRIIHIWTSRSEALVFNEICMPYYDKQ